MWRSGILALAAAGVALLGYADARAGSVRLTWTAPGDDGNSGQAAAYDLRYAAAAVSGTDTTTWWNAASRAGSLPRPQVAGARETFTVAGLDSGRTYYFILRTADEVPNVSAFSNISTRVAMGNRAPPAQLVVNAIYGFPNPAHDHVTVHFIVGAGSDVAARSRITVFDLVGHTIRALVNETLPAGEHLVTWDCRSSAGGAVAPGLYNIVLESPSGRGVAQLAILP